MRLRWGQPTLYVRSPKRQYSRKWDRRPLSPCTLRNSTPARARDAHQETPADPRRDSIWHVLPPAVRQHRTACEGTLSRIATKGYLRRICKSIVRLHQHRYRCICTCRIRENSPEAELQDRYQENQVAVAELIVPVRESVQEWTLLARGSMAN